MLFFTHKYQPQNKQDFYFHHDILNKLEVLSQSTYFPHFIISGNSGSGKYTLILYYLSQLFKTKSVYKTENIIYQIENQNKQTTDLNIIKSNYHFEIDAEDYNYQDKKLFYLFIKELCNTIDISNQKYKVIIIRNAEKLSLETQYTLNRIMETHTKTFRIIFITNNISLLHKNIQSRCINLIIPSPTDLEIKNTLLNIYQMEKLNISQSIINEIITKSNRNINKAIFLLQLQITNNNQEELVDNTVEIFINEFKDKIKNIDIKNIHEIRNDIYLILLHISDLDEIFKILTDTFIEEIKEIDKIKKILDLAIQYQENCNLGYRDIFHIETFITGVINIYKNNNISIIKDII